MYQNQNFRTYQRPTEPPKKSKKRPVLIAAVVLILLLSGAASFVLAKHTDTATKVASTPSSTKTTTKPTTTPTTASTQPEAEKYDINTPSSVDVVVNKARPIPSTYAPQLVVPNVTIRSNATGDERQVSSVMAGPLKTLMDAASAAGVPMMLSSGYRSYQLQVSLYNYYVQTQGQAVADSQSARPGHSEHQTGLAADVAPADGSCNVEVCFATTPAGKWLAANAYKYGFIIRYPADKTTITGYSYEPWHIRYIGTDLAAKLHDAGIETLEEYFKLPAAPDYT